jgi:hypothetical protein
MGKPRDSSPPTPPDVRVRIRRFGGLSYRPPVNLGIPSEAMKLTIELGQEVDARWIAEVPELNILLYEESRLGRLPILLS